MTMDHLNVKPRSDRFPSFQKPTIIGYYSVDKDRRCHPHAANLKYLYHHDAKTKLDLNIGFERYIQKVEILENEEKIDALLIWLLKYGCTRNVFDLQTGNSTFVCFRGLLANVMRTPYENLDGWLICASKIKNLIFLCAFNTDEKKHVLQRGQTPKEKRFEFWGRKFEQYLLTESPDKKPNVTVPVNASEEFALIFRSKLNQHYILYGAEIDGVDSSSPIDVNSNVSGLNTSALVELKTSRRIQNQHQDRNFKRFKLIKWWSQSFLVGIERIICGFRDDDGIIQDIQSFNTKDLPKMTHGTWNPSVCMNFLDDFLAFVKTTLKNEPDFETWRFDWTPSSNWVSAHKVTDRSEYSILPDWFIRECDTGD